MSLNRDDDRGIDPLTDGPETDQKNFSPQSSTEETASKPDQQDLLGSRSLIYRIAAGVVTLILLAVVVLEYFHYHYRPDSDNNLLYRLYVVDKAA